MSLILLNAHGGIRTMEDSERRVNFPFSRFFFLHFAFNRDKGNARSVFRSLLVKRRTERNYVDDLPSI